MALITQIREAMITLIIVKAANSKTVIPGISALAMLWLLEQEIRSEIARILRRKGFYLSSAKFYALSVVWEPLNPHGWHDLGAITGSQECFEQEALLLQNAAKIDWSLNLKYPV